MEKNRSGSAFSKGPFGTTSQAANTSAPPSLQWQEGHGGSPNVRRRSWRFLLWFATVPVILLLVGLLYCVAIEWTSPPLPAAIRPTLPDGDRSLTPLTPDERLCNQFLERKNAGDPAAADLLGPAPVVPATPISPEEADRLQTEFFLRQDLQVVGVGRDKAHGKPVLYTKGNVSAPTLNVRTGAGVETAQRTMANPDLVVEVRDGRIYGVAAHLHW